MGVAGMPAAGGRGATGGGGMASSGTDAYYGASRAFWQAAASAAVAFENHKAELRRQALQRKARTNPLKLAAANRAVAEGDIPVACLIYNRLALSRPRSSVTEEAKRRLMQLQEQARRELSSIEATFTDGESDSPRPSALTPVVSTDQIQAAFAQYDQLARKYRHLGAVGGDKGEIALQIIKRRRQYAPQLNEAEAKTLWELGQKYEEQDHLCCAFLVYEEATKLTPAPSARLAKNRFAEMRKDSQIVDSAETCRDVQWCLEKYLRAEQHLFEGKRELAQAEFRQIVERGPEGSEVYREAREQLAEAN